MRRLKYRYERWGCDGLWISAAGSRGACALKRQRYADFSVQHFWEKVRAALREAEQVIVPVADTRDIGHKIH